MRWKAPNGPLLLWLAIAMAISYLTYESGSYYRTVSAVSTDPVTVTATWDGRSCGSFGSGCPIQWTDTKGERITASLVHAFGCGGALVESGNYPGLYLFDRRKRSRDERSNLWLPDGWASSPTVTYQRKDPSQFCLGGRLPKADSAPVSKWLGATIGWLLIGLVLRVWRPSSGVGWLGRLSDILRSSSPYNVHLYGMVFHLLRCDGRIDAKEEDVLSNVIKELTMHASSAESRRIARAVTEASVLGNTFHQHASLFAQQVRSDDAASEFALEWLAKVALADGVIHPREQYFIMEAADILGVPRPFVAGILESMQRSERREGVNTGDPDPWIGARIQSLRAPSAWAYAELNCPQGASRSAIKRHYRAAAKRYHPDALRGRGFPPEMIRSAELKFRRIQQAYDALTSKRR